jgi:vacuolar-type H+-ATPase subunit E/Vma4
MTEEDEEFNRIEREAAMRKEAVVSAISKEQKEYERGVIDGMQKQAQSSVDKAVNAMSQREWVGLDLAEMDAIIDGNMAIFDSKLRDAVYAVVIDTMTTLMEKNCG